MGTKGDLLTDVGWLLESDSVIQKLLFYQDFLTQPFQRFKENGRKKQKYPVSEVLTEWPHCRYEGKSNSNNYSL